MQGISRALRHPIRPTLPTMDLRWALCLKQRGRWRPRITLVNKVCMHKQQLELDGNELQQWTSNRLESRRPYKESLVILIPMLPSDCSPALHITRRHLMAMLIQHQVLGEEEVGTSETMILSVTLRPEQWVTASCTKINGTDVYMRSSQTASVYHRTPVFLPVCNTTADLQKPSKPLQIQCSFVKKLCSINAKLGALPNRLSAFGMGPL